MYDQWKLVLTVAVSLSTVVTTAFPSRDSFVTEEGLIVTRDQKSVVSDLQQRAVCKFNVESEVDADTAIKYENVRCVEEVFGSCEQLQTSLTLPSGRSLTIKSACVSVNRTVATQQAQSKEGRLVVM
jgi:hypothetical protein